MQPSAKVIADSISPDGSRVTTMEVVIHRFVLAELNTHRVFSRNSASSRAIPISRTLESVKQDPAFPIYWGAEKPGMQSGEELTGHDRLAAEALFREVRSMTVRFIEQYLKSQPLLGDNVRLHKSVLNRLLEPFLWHKVIVTSTEWENFFGLRCHPMAQPEIRVAAEMMEEAYNFSQPKIIGYGDWHAPYANISAIAFSNLEMALKTSAARCAWVSTSNHDGEHSWEAIERMYDRLSTAEPMHASPFEHQCTPGDGPGNFRGWQQLRHMLEDGNPPWWNPDKPSRLGREGDTQPLPVVSDAPIAHRMVQDDLEERLKVGIERYGQPLQAFNGRDSLRDAYEEVLDLAVYLRNAIYEQENTR